MKLWCLKIHIIAFEEIIVLSAFREIVKRKVMHSLYNHRRNIILSITFRCHSNRHTHDIFLNIVNNVRDTEVESIKYWVLF